MEKEEINALFKQMEQKSSYVYTSSLTDKLIITTNKLPDDTVTKKRLVIFSKTPAQWKKNEIQSLAKAFSSREIIFFEEGKSILTKELNIYRDIPYTDKLKQKQAPYSKKLIHLIKKTRMDSFLWLLSKDNVIIPTKISKNGMSVEHYVDTDEEGRRYIPIFMESDMIRVYAKLKKNEQDFEMYKPYLIKFSQLENIMKKYGVKYLWLNPGSYDIKNKDFSLKIKEELISYIQTEIKEKYRSGGK